MLKKITIQIISIYSIISYTSAHAMDGTSQIGAFQYIKNITTQKTSIFEDEFSINAIKKRFEDADFWIAQQLKKNTDSTLEKAFARIKEYAHTVYNDILLISNNISSIKTSSESLAHFHKVSRNFSQNRDLLKAELEPKSKLNSLKKRNFPPVSSAKKEIANVLLAYAEVFVHVAQKAITDFAKLDASLYLEESKQRLHIK